MGPDPQPAWRIAFSADAERWYKALGPRDTHRINRALDQLATSGPNLGRPHADRIKGSRHHNLKELRSPGSSLRMLFAFDPNRTAVMLVGGDKRGDWNRWYERAIQRAEKVFDEHLRREGRWRDNGRGGGRGSEPRSP